jgi:two-component system response regulator GlrR
VTHSTPERSPEQTLREILASAEANVPPWSAARPVRVGAGMVAVGLAMRSLVEKLPRIARSGSSVLLHGESGTGKEVIANEIHRLSACSAGPFVAVNCAAIPAALFESELFGHRRGAFTGAERDRAGLIAQADGGTLFLDEIGELPLAVQAKLLRALQTREVRPLGGSAAIPVDIRVIGATHRDLAAMVAAGSFRQDLFYRLDVVRLALPPLRERREDVPLLAQHFLEKHRRPDSPVQGFEPEALAALAARDWPGNVRELEIAIERAVLLREGGVIDESDLRFAPRDVPPGAPPRDERGRIVAALESCAWDLGAAAGLLGLDRAELFARMKSLGIERS